MLYRLISATALAAGPLSYAQAQVVQVLPSCGTASLPLGPGGRMFADQTGNLCTNAGAAGGTSNAYPGADYATAPRQDTGNTTTAAISAATGAQADAAWSGTGNGSLIALGKAQQNTLSSFSSFYYSTNVALGTPSDAAYNGTGSPSLIALGKGQYGLSSTPLPRVPAASATIAGPTPATATGTSLVGKASAANLYGYSLTQGATAGFFAFLNVTAAPAASAAIAPLECVPVPANGYVARRQDIPDRYTTGLVIVSTSSCTTYTAVTPVLMSVVAQ